jgi:hypothetical protein
MTAGELQLLCESIGHRVRELSRVHFVWDGELDTSEGDLTLVFDSGRTIRLSHTPHGYDLSITSERWINPFIESPNEVEAEWVQEHGYLVEVCVNKETDWQPFAGRPLTQVGRLIYIDHDEPCGVTLRFQHDLVLCVYNLADEVMVERTLNCTWFTEQPVCSHTEPLPAAKPHAT